MTRQIKMGWSCGVVPGHEHLSKEEAQKCIREHMKLTPEQKLEVARQALHDIINPMAYLKRKADQEGGALNNRAVEIAYSWPTANSIAKDALFRIEAGE